jgi:hypothetical protein
MDSPGWRRGRAQRPAPAEQHRWHGTARREQFYGKAYHARRKRACGEELVALPQAISGGHTAAT